MFQNDNEQWQAELQQRLSEVVAKKFGPLAEEVRRLQSAFQEAGASVERLAAQGGAGVSPDDLAGVREQVEQAVTEAARRSAEQSEGDVQARLDNVRAETESRVRQELEGQISELRAQLEASRRAANEAANAVPVMPLPLAGEAQSAAVPAQGAVDADALKAAVDDIDAQRQQADVLAALVRQAANFAPRAVFFVVKGGNAIGWKANGFSNGLSDETVRALSFPSQAAPLIAAALDRQQAVQLDADDGAANAALLGQYGPPGAQATAIPLVIRGKAAAVLYADGGAESQAAVSTPAIETLMRVTGMAIELLPARRGAEQPPRPAQAEAAVSAPAAVAAPAPPPAPEAAAAPYAPEPAVTTAPQSFFQAAGEEAVRVQPIQTPTFVQPAHEEPPAPSYFTPPQPPVQEPTPPPAPPPAPVTSANAADPSAEERAHMDARRFARLLVSEIKLYNEAKVAEGRRSNDLYERLKEDIDRSRQMYEKRVSASVAAKFDYFYDELVHTLGEGSAEKLGSGCPGPTVPVN